MVQGNVPAVIEIQNDFEPGFLLDPFKCLRDFRIGEGGGGKIDDEENGKQSPPAVLLHIQDVSVHCVDLGGEPGNQTRRIQTDGGKAHDSIFLVHLKVLHAVALKKVFGKWSCLNFEKILAGS
jgi:hypothetical protein